MALQPAAGARDLNPREVEQNRAICAGLAEVYRLWGYQQVDPPSVERVDTLEAGGGIDGRELVLLASEERLGLRPELTASIARAASTRMAQRPRPLRLWTNGTIFRSSTGDSGQQRIHEQLQSGVELLGERSAAADVELISLLLAAAAQLQLKPHNPQLLIGHHGLLAALLADVPDAHKSSTRRALTGFDPLALEAIPLAETQHQRLRAVMRLRGGASEVLYALEQWLGPIPLLGDLQQILSAVAATAEDVGVSLRLDPTFQPHFALYDGLVLKLVCHGGQAPLAIASGGRYDALVGRFSPADSCAAGVGFGFDVDALRELLGHGWGLGSQAAPVLVSYAASSGVVAALETQRQLHGQGLIAELHPDPLASQEQADAIASARGCSRAVWVGS
ncbi:MAG: ATP phosphoribosyltransferase regulatory subunit [Cyanobium sp. M30B3]|nr:MAG: ATP phosphoribosyltransferase regulatory subunit [Cyanobium sp. M30B3]